MSYRYFVLYKPFKVLSQFTDEGTGKRTLADLYPFPKDVYPVGRLDFDSEGLLILTNDKKLNHQLLNPSFAHQRTYLSQVEHIPTKNQLNILEKGVFIKVNKRLYRTKRAVVQLLNHVPLLPERHPPIRFRKNIPTAWLELKLIEGKNRQVRKMTAKIGCPTLRLVRIAIEDLKLGKMQVGAVKEMQEATIYRQLKLGSR